MTERIPEPEEDDLSEPKDWPDVEGMIRRYADPVDDLSEPKEWPDVEAMARRYGFPAVELEDDLSEPKDWPVPPIRTAEEEIAELMQHFNPDVDSDADPPQWIDLDKLGRLYDTPGTPHAGDSGENKPAE